MGKETSHSKISKSDGFLRLLLLNESSSWTAFRAPTRALKRTATFFAFLFFLTLLALAGWIFSRAQSESLKNAIIRSELKQRSLETELQNWRKNPDAAPGVASTERSFLPALLTDDSQPTAALVAKFAPTYDPRGMKLGLSFEIQKLGAPSESKGKVYWIVLLTGSQGILSFPASFNAGNGELLNYQKGQPIEDLRGLKRVKGEFKLSSFVEASGSEPLQVFLFLFDAKGGLLHRVSAPLQMAGIGTKDSAGAGGISPNGK